MDISFKIKSSAGILPENLFAEISELRNIPLEYVRYMLMYNIVTYDQLSMITGRSRPNIDVLSREKYSRREKKMIQKLKTVAPFAIPENGKVGPIFIVLDRGCLDYIESCLKKDGKAH